MCLLNILKSSTTTLSHLSPPLLSVLQFSPERLYCKSDSKFSTSPYPSTPTVFTRSSSLLNPRVRDSFPFIVSSDYTDIVLLLLFLSHLPLFQFLYPFPKSFFWPIGHRYPSETSTNVPPYYIGQYLTVNQPTTHFLLEHPQPSLPFCFLRSIFPEHISFSDCMKQENLYCFDL